MTTIGVWRTLVVATVSILISLTPVIDFVSAFSTRPRKIVGTAATTNHCRSSVCSWKHCATNNNDRDRDTSSNTKSPAGSQSGDVNDAIPSGETAQASNDPNLTRTQISSVSGNGYTESNIEENQSEINQKNLKSKVTSNTEIDTAASMTGSFQQILEILVAFKEKVYGRIRSIFRDLVTLISRSAQKAQTWAVEDETGQLVSSSLALVAFFAAVAAFAAWNIQVLSGGKSQWKAPGVTVPVVRGLPNESTMIQSTTIRFQKPQWRAPKLQTSYGSSSSSSETTNK